MRTVVERARFFNAVFERVTQRQVRSLAEGEAQAFARFPGALLEQKASSKFLTSDMRSGAKPRCKSSRERICESLTLLHKTYFLLSTTKDLEDFPRPLPGKFPGGI
jgi:hypothetical protein